MAQIPVPSPQAADLLAELERFVTENDDLLVLEERIGRFNIFDALGIVRREIQHSNFLAWLLDPHASHGQGSLFLRAVLMDIFKQARQQSHPVPITAIELDGGDLDTFEVRREWNHIDLLILDPSRRLVIAVENKVDSSEHSDQLNRYDKALDKEFSDWKRLHVFLTPAGDAPSSKGWVSYSYRRLWEVVSRVKRTSGGSLGTDVSAFIDHYLKLLETELMDDQQLIELCRRIYTNHRRAIDLIVEHAGVGGVSVLKPVAEAVEAMPGKPWVFPNRTGRWFRCIPQAWEKIIPPIAIDVPNPHALVFYEVWYDKSHVAIALTIAPCSDREIRLKLVEHFRNEAPTLQLKNKIKAKLDSEWTRLVTYHPYRCPDGELDADEAAANTIKSLQELLSRVDAVTESLGRFFNARG